MRWRGCRSESAPGEITAESRIDHLTGQATSAGRAVQSPRLPPLAQGKRFPCGGRFRVDPESGEPAPDGRAAPRPRMRMRRAAIPRPARVDRNAAAR